MEKEARRREKKRERQDEDKEFWVNLRSVGKFRWRVGGGEAANSRRSATRREDSKDSEEEEDRQIRVMKMKEKKNEGEENEKKQECGLSEKQATRKPAGPPDTHTHT